MYTDIQEPMLNAAQEQFGVTHLPRWGAVPPLGKVHNLPAQKIVIHYPIHGRHHRLPRALRPLAQQLAVAVDLAVAPAVLPETQWLQPIMSPVSSAPQNAELAATDN